MLDDKNNPLILEDIYREVAKDLNIDIKLVKHLFEYQCRQTWIQCKTLSHTRINLKDLFTFRFHDSKFEKLTNTKLFKEKPTIAKIKAMVMFRIRFEEKRITGKVKQTGNRKKINK